MKPNRTFARPAFMRSLAWLGVVLATAAAGIHLARAFRALISGQIKFPLPIGAADPVIRTTEPFLFHAGLLLVLLIAVAFVYTAVKTWQHGVGGRAERENQPT